ncbi:MAG TPA: putative toxin-antitoxin system toxin component, PIN family [Burkholderiales bacterium]
MLLSPQLIAAYERADYVVHGADNGGFTLKIGRRSAPLDALLEAQGATSAAFVTAANPRGEQRSEAQNSAALAELEGSLAHPSYRGEGRDPDGRWPAEPSLLVMGIARGEAEALGRACRQNAIVFVEKGAAPELVMLAKLRLVLDTQVWLDWLVFDDPSTLPIRALLAAERAEIFIDGACEAELERVLGYRLGRRALDEPARSACLARCRAIAKRLQVSPSEKSALPSCSDPDDQKLLELALAAGADCLVTRDQALLELRTPLFQILTADALSGTCRSRRPT